MSKSCATTSKCAVLLVLCMLATSCHRSGTWTDDPENFERAWGQAAPSGLHIVHSWYWRSAHFTREEVYFFEFSPHPQFPAAFVKENDWRPTDSNERLLSELCFPRPSWFAPKPPSSYQAWSLPSEHLPGFLLLDKETKEFFIYGCQM